MKPLAIIPTRRSHMRRIIILIATTLCALAIPASAHAGFSFASSTWSGYFVLMAPGYQIDTAAAQFNVPRADCRKTKGKFRNNYSSIDGFPKGPTGGNGTAIWTGIDGVGTLPRVEQGGIYMYCDKKSQAHYEAWWEMYRPGPTPNSATPISARPHFLTKPVDGGTRLPRVRPGDNIDIGVEKTDCEPGLCSGKVYTIQISDT